MFLAPCGLSASIRAAASHWNLNPDPRFCRFRQGSATGTQLADFGFASEAQMGAMGFFNIAQ
jgi:hypothetical protein